MTGLALYNPLIPGFNPDPSVVRVDGFYYLVTSTFEYLPGIPVYRSTDLVIWEQIGNVATREEQVGVADLQTNLGVWAPTIRYRHGRFFVIVTVAGSARGCVVFTTADPAGEWSDGITLEGISGIDPDLAWDEHGAAYVTYSGLVLAGPEMGRHLGIQQARVDLEAGRALETPRSLWSGSGLQFPEAPHVFQRGNWWYLMIAEGGTERGHGVSIARAASIEGPFEPAPSNPVLSARSTTRPIQNTGHADIVRAPDGLDVLVLLGMRPLGGTRAFSPLGRETFVTPVEWVDGWPKPEPVALCPRTAPFSESIDLTDTRALDDPAWIAVRQPPTEVGSTRPERGGLVLVGRGEGMSALCPVFVGRRQRHLTSTTTIRLDISEGSGGLALRYDETTFIAMRARRTDVATDIVVTAAVPTLEQTWQIVLAPTLTVDLTIATRRPTPGFSSEGMGGDRIQLLAAPVVDSEQPAPTLITELDGRFWSAESATSFTGRVTGAFAVDGTVIVSEYHYSGSEEPALSLLPGHPEED